MTDYDARRENAQGRPNPCLPNVPFPLVGVDVTATLGGTVEIQDLVVRNARTDAYGTRIEFDIAKGSKWAPAGVSWLNVGAEEDKKVGESADGKITKRIWCHEDFKDENIAAVKAQMVAYVSEKIEKLQGLLEELEPPAPSRPRP